MTYQGMDPDVVQRIGGDLQRVGAELNRMSNHIEILVRQIAQHWHGPVSADFAHQWNGLRRAQALHAAEAISGLGRSAVQQAEEQRRVSGGSSGPGASTTPGSGRQPGSRLGPDLSWAGERLGAMSTLLGLPTFVDVERWQSVVARAPSLEAFDGLLERGVGLARSLHGGGVGEFVDDIAAAGSKPFALMGNIGTVLGLAGDGFTFAGDVVEGDQEAMWFSGADTIGSALQATKSNPVAYLGGLAIKQWSDVGKLALDTDWSASVWPNPFEGNNLKDIYLDSLGEGVTKTFTGFLGNL